jgi:hypothetical protein
VKGVAASNGAQIAHPARFDSVAFCSLGGAEFWGGKNSVIARNNIVGDIRFLANGGLPCYSSQNLDPGCVANSQYDTLRYNRIDLGVIQPNDRSFEFKAWTQYCLIDSNRVSGHFDNNGSTLADGGIALVSYNSYLQTFRDNHWEFEATSAHMNGGSWSAVYLRDSTHSCTFERDTILALVNSPSYTCAVLLSASGSFPSSVSDNIMRNCIIKVRGDIYWQDKFWGWVLDNNTFASADGLPFWVMGNWSNSKVRHNAFWASGEALRIEGSGNKFSGTGNELTSNIFYSTAASAPSNSGGLTMWKDSQTGFTSNNNLFFTPGYQSQPGDRSLVWSGYYNSQPGTGKPWYNLNGQDGASRHGSPQWADSSFANLDVRLRSGSPAIGLGLAGTDAGPIPFGGGAVDATPPASVANLGISNVTDTGLLLSWTAPGDDGTVGIAQLYDLRYSTAAITSTNFANATPVTVQPVPAIAGTAQSYVMAGLTPGTTYWFAIKARDDWGNWSGLSNVPSAATTGSDTTPPARVTDLSTP